MSRLPQSARFTLVALVLATPTLAWAAASDDFDAALDLGALPATVYDDTTDATSGEDDPTACVPTGRTVWYAYTADADATVVLSTLGSEFDTTLSVWTGARGSLDLVGCNDDDPDGGLHSALAIDVVAGETYWIQVGAWSDSPGGALVLDAAVYTPPVAPANDDFADATPIDGTPFTDEVDTSGATPEDTDGDCRGGGPTVWYAYTATTDGTLAAHTVGSDYDTTLSVWTGDAGALDNVGCNDDAVGLASRLRFDVVAGETYYLMVGAYAGGAGGNLVFTLDEAPAPLELELFVDAGTWNVVTGAVTLTGEATCSDPAYFELFGAVTQRGGTNTEAWGDVWGYGYCDGTGAFTADVWGWSGTLLAGHTEVSLFGTAASDVTYERTTFTVEDTVNVRATR